MADHCGLVFLVIHDDEHLFMCLLAISISYFVKCVHSYYFLTDLFVLLFLSCGSSLYILNIGPLSDVCVANVFSYSVACLLFSKLYLLKKVCNFHKALFPSLKKLCLLVFYEIIV